MNINQKRLVTAMMQASLILPLSIGLVACGGSDEGYSDPEFEKPPIPVDKSDPAIYDKESTTEGIYSFGKNPTDGSSIVIDTLSQVVLLNAEPASDADNSLVVGNIGLYRKPKTSEKIEGPATKENTHSALLLDSPQDLYSGAGFMVSDSGNVEGVITDNQLNDVGNNYLTKLQSRIGNDHKVNVNKVTSGFNADNTTITYSGTITRKNGQIGSDKHPSLQHKRMRDEMLAVQIGSNIWTKPPMASNWGQTGAESKELAFTVTTWAYKGGTYMWVSTSDVSKAEQVAAKFGRYNNGSAVASSLNPLTIKPGVDTRPVRDALSKTEPVNYLPKNGVGETDSYSDLVSEVKLQNVQPKGKVSEHIQAENLSLYRAPKSGTAFETGVPINKDNALGALLVDDPSLMFSAASTRLISGEGEGVITAGQLNSAVSDYVRLMKNRLGNSYEVVIENNIASSNSDGASISITGSVNKVGATPSGKTSLMQHRLLRDELIATQFNKDVVTDPTLSGSTVSEKMGFKITTWAYKGSTYVWVAAYDKTKEAAIEAKYARYNSGKDLSSVKNPQEASDALDKNNPSIADKASVTEKVFYFIKDSAGRTGDFVDKISRIALRNVQPEGNNSVAISENNVSLLRLPMTGSFVSGVPTTMSNSIGSVLLDDPDLSYSGAGSVIAIGDPTATITTSVLSDNANNYFNLLKNRLGSNYNVSVSNVNRYSGIDGATITLSGTINRVNGAGVGTYPVMQHKRMRDEMLSAQYNRPIWSNPTLMSNWSAGGPESKVLNFTVTTWAFKGSTYLWTSTYDQAKAGQVQAKYGRYDKGIDLSSALHSLAQSEGVDLMGNKVDRNGDPIEE